MTSISSQSMLPDSTSGIIFALEGIDRTCVVLNGPTGCKYYHSAISEQQRTRQWAFDPLDFPAIWYFGQPRVPSTYLDSHDYVYGSHGKIEEALSFLREHADIDLLAVVNSPGAALIGDDLSGIVERAAGGLPVVTVQTPGFSSDICGGFECGIQAVLDQLVSDSPGGAAAPGGAATGKAAMPSDGTAGHADAPDDAAAPAHANAPEDASAPARAGALDEVSLAAHATAAGEPTVNILGLSLHHRNHEGDARELERLLQLVGVHVNCFIGQGCNLESLRRVPLAHLNVVVHPEYGLETARYLERRFGTPFLCAAPPVGFAATENLVRSICDAVGADAAPFNEEAEKARARAYVYISRLNSLTGLPKGVRYSVEGTCSELLAYTSFLTEYLGMAPVALTDVAPARSCMRSALEERLRTLGFPAALDADPETAHGDIVFASGETIARLKTGDEPFTGVEIALPTLGYVDVIPKTHWGLQGTLQLVEHVINGLVY